MLVAAAARKFVADDCVSLAATVAYAALFSIFPLLLAVAGLVGALIEVPGARQRVFDAALAYMPASRDLVEETLRSVLDERRAGALGIVLLVGSGQVVFGAAVHAMNPIFGAPTRTGLLDALRRRVAVMLGAGTALLTSLAATVLLRMAGRVGLQDVGLERLRDVPVWPAVTSIIAAACSFLLFLLVYRLAPGRPVTWLQAATGAALAAVLFEAAKWAFVLYVEEFASYEAVYGAVGTVFVLLTWCYVSALILLFGAELSAASGHRAPPGEDAATETASSTRQIAVARGSRRWWALPGLAFAAAVLVAVAARRRSKRRGRAPA